MRRGLTLIELLEVIAFMAVCISNTRQINPALRLYADDHGDAIRAMTNMEALHVTYKDSIQSYLSRNGSSPNDLLVLRARRAWSVEMATGTLYRNTFPEGSCPS